MRLEHAVKNYYRAKLRSMETPDLPALHFAHERSPRSEMLLNVIVHAAIAAVLIFSFFPGRGDSDLSMTLGKRAGELSLNKHLYSGMVSLSRYIKTIRLSN